MSTKARSPKFDIGEIVYLVAGGPGMAIQRPIVNGHDEFTGEYYCQWFAGRKSEQSRFPEESLTKKNPKP
ncbi:DUF2158 domain-containing protein [Tatumella ptyseos]|uniref:Uncharacterized small protein n=1 Tax=Tatumella ptyseos TaxID=82987 RepID=A0A2X5NRB2_9GAMM|nr:DUF2158 domain-containing protein [Tatumella ptyseos]SQK75746.1 Uncharacterized small protein [Tatumella ptyseos]